MRRERRYIFLPLPQRRELHGKNAEPVIEVLTKATIGDLLTEVTIGGGHDTDVNLTRGILANPFELSFLEYSKQLRLMYQRDLADFVEKKGPAVGMLKSSDTVTQRAGEGALGMAEKLALEKFRRDRPAVDTDERLLAPGLRS